MTRSFKTPITVEGDISANGVLKSIQSSGDEGGQIDLTASVTNTTLTTGVSIDVFQNKLRIFETGGNNRGYYIDITGGGNSVGTNLVAGGSGTVTSIVAGTTGLTGGTITTSGTIDIDTTKVPRLLTNTNIFAASTGATTLTVRQGATQSTTNLMEWQDTTPTALALVTSGGSIYSSANGGFGATAAISTARLSVTGAASGIGVIVRANATTPGDLQQWQTSTPTTVASISATGAFTATSINKVTITAPATGSTFTLADGKTHTISNSISLAGVDGKTLTLDNNLELAGTDGTKMTFPSTNATIARTDTAQTFTGTQTIDVIAAGTATGSTAALFNNTTSGTITIGGVVGSTAAVGTINIGNNAGITGGTKAINVGTGATAGTTTITIGSTTGSTTTINGTLSLGTPLAYNQGGTGQNTWAKGDLLYASSTTALARLTISTTDGYVLTANSTSGLAEWRVASSGSSGFIDQQALTFNYR